MILQPRDLDLITALERSIRLILLVQIAAWWGTDIANVRKRAWKLADLGLTEIRSFQVYQPSDVTRTLRSWKIGEPLPTDDGRVSNATRRRYDGLPVRRMQACCAPGTNIKQESHEVGLAQVFVTHPWKKEFVGEQAYPASEKGYRMKVVDAMVCEGGDPRRPKFAIDYLTRYSRQRVRALSLYLSEVRNPPLPFMFF